MMDLVAWHIDPDQNQVSGIAFKLSSPLHRRPNYLVSANLLDSQYS